MHNSIEEQQTKISSFLKSIGLVKYQIVFKEYKIFYLKDLEVEENLIKIQNSNEIALGHKIKFIKKLNEFNPRELNPMTKQKIRNILRTKSFWKKSKKFEIIKPKENLPVLSQSTT